MPNSLLRTVLGELSEQLLFAKSTSIVVFFEVLYLLAYDFGDLIILEFNARRMCNPNAVHG